MEKQEYLPGEELVTESENKLITLTNFRLRFYSSNRGSAYIVSLMLNRISSIEVHYRSLWFLLIPSIILIVGGLLAGAQNQGDIMIAGLVIGLLLALIYILSRKHIVTVSSMGGAKINFETKGMKRETLMNFINKIEGEILKYEKIQTKI